MCILLVTHKRGFGRALRFREYNFRSVWKQFSDEMLDECRDVTWTRPRTRTEDNVVTIVTTISMITMVVMTRRATMTKAGWTFGGVGDKRVMELCALSDDVMM